MTCQCGHRASSHRYMVTIGENAGECLSPQCPCGGVEGLSDAQNSPSETRTASL